MSANGMPSIEEHEKTAKELIEDIEEKIRLNTLGKRQRIVGFAVSEAANNLFSAFLHRQNLLSPGFNLNHSVFSSRKKTEEMFYYNFKEKEEILPILIRIEELRNRLCYGREKDETEAREAVFILFKLKSLIEEAEGDKK